MLPVRACLPHLPFHRVSQKRRGGRQGGPPPGRGRVSCAGVTGRRRISLRTVRPRKIKTSPQDVHRKRGLKEGTCPVRSDTAHTNFWHRLLYAAAHARATPISSAKIRGVDGL